jgi:hypothetical protein
MSQFIQYSQSFASHIPCSAKTLKFLAVGLIGLLLILEFNITIFLLFAFFSVLGFALTEKIKQLDATPGQAVQQRFNERYVDGGSFKLSTTEKNIKVSNFVKDGGSFQ